MKSIFLLALLLPAAAATAQPPDTQPPQQLQIPGLIEKEEEGAFLILGRIFPVGWSPEGLFAYVYEAPDEACGCYFFELIVQDLATDRVAWHFEYVSDHFEIGDPERFDDLPAIWKAKGKEFAAKLRELGIVRRDDPKLELFAASTAKLKVKLTIEEKGDGEKVLRHVSRYTVELSAAQGRKTIYRSEARPEVGPFAVQSQGYLRSPFEARIAVLLEESWPGWEGPPAVVRLHFTGAGLERGFR